MHTLLRAACDEGRLSPFVPPVPVPPVIYDWNRVWSALESQPRGDEVLRFLDSLLPREHIVVAQKPGGVRMKPTRQAPYALRNLRARLKRLVKNGYFRVGQMEIGWFVRPNRVA
jgi:hypothetical protein